MSSAWSADKAAVPLGRRIPTAGVLFRSDSLLDRFPYEDIGSCLPEEGSQHQVRQPRRKKERVCIIRRTRPREASLTGITKPSLPQLLWKGASLPFDRLNKPALPSTHRKLRRSRVMPIDMTRRGFTMLSKRSMVLPPLAHHHCSVLMARLSSLTLMIS